MLKMRCLTGALCWALVLLFSPAGQAAIDTYEFQNADNRERFHTLTEELRCPKCQNQNLADSNSPIAMDMRREIHRMVEEGQSDQDVVQFMVDRYGDFVNYRPRQDSSTAVLWYGPIALLVVGLVVVVIISRRRGQTKSAEPAEKSLSESERERLKRLLDEDKGQG